jgi:hypothetical protein
VASAFTRKAFFRAQPVDQVTAAPGSNALVVSAQAGANFTPCYLDAPLQFQWYWNGQPLAAANTYYLRTNNYGVFQCQIKGLGGTVMSRVATVNPPPATLTISTPSQNGSVDQPTVVLEITAHSAVPMQYQLERSTDLQNWTAALLPFSLSNGGWTNVSLDPSVPQAFYRVRIP